MSAIVQHAIEYLGYLAEFGLFAVLVRRRNWKQDAPLGLYVLSFILLDGAARLYVLYDYGASSLAYFYCYWVTDVLLTLGAFILVCIFFRRASAAKPEAWSILRPMLAAVFVLIAFVSYLSISQHYDHLFGRFMVGFQQNLYFACLVLNTLLYIMLQQWNSEDEELGLFVTGLGIEFAGPAAGMALMYLTPGGHDAGIMYPYIAQFCNLGMFALWIYAAAVRHEKVTTPVTQRGYQGQVPAFAEVAVRSR